MTTYSVCIATLNRREALLRAVGHVMAQSRLPMQVVIVDASDDWERTRDDITGLIGECPDVALEYLHSPIRSSAVQRNEGISRCQGDVIIILDDDCFLYSDCAEAILVLFDADVEQSLAGARITMVDAPPPSPHGEPETLLAQKKIWEPRRGNEAAEGRPQERCWPLVSSPRLDAEHGGDIPSL